MFNQKVWATFTPRVFPSTSPCHGMTKPVLSLYSFLRPSCFLNWVSCQHHQAPTWPSNAHLYDSSTTSFKAAVQPSLFPPIKYAGFALDAPRRPRTWRVASFAYTVSI